MLPKSNKTPRVVRAGEPATETGSTEHHEAVAQIATLPERPRSMPQQPPTVDAAYTASIRLSIAAVTKVLVEVLGRKLVMRLSKVSDPHAITGWIDGTRTPRDPQQIRLRTAYRVFQIVNAAENEYAARAWFIGLNPQLGDDAPIDAIRDDDLKDVVVAAQAFTRTS